METEESPLDVLSRAATMVQENQALSSRDDVSKSNAPSQKQTTKWKRDRRARLPEYSRKSDPKFAEVFGTDPPVTASESNGISRQAAIPGSLPLTNGHHTTHQSHDTPLDMSLRQRGQPPSYAQTISNPTYKSSSSYKRSVLHVGARDELPSGISMCDPIIDEHFRRSLGSEYHSIFQNNNLPKETLPATQQRSHTRITSPSTNVIEMMDSASLSVDDHFAKALGDTWAKLNRKESDIKRDGAKENLVTI